MSLLEAAITILHEAGKPLKVHEIWTRIEEQGLFITKGRTPWQHLRNEMLKRCERARESNHLPPIFRKPMRGVYDLLYHKNEALRILYHGASASIAAAPASSQLRVDATEKPIEIQVDWFPEGEVRWAITKSVDRNRKARDACIACNGWVCKACEVDLERRYGELGRNLIEVHHIKPLADRTERYMVDPTTDLVPLCPSCHAAIHRSNPLIAVAELKAILAREQRQHGGIPG
jgi:hypothetical protein